MGINACYKKTEVGIIPSNWKVSTLGELTTLMTNGFVGTATTYYTDSEEGVLYIQGYNVEENTFNFNGIKRVTLDFHKKHLKSCLQTGDLLTVQTGDVGLTTIVSDELAGSNCHALIISRFKKAISDPKFFSLYLNSFQGRNRLKEIEIGSTMKHINVGDLKYFFVPEPPIDEQTAIAKALSDADALIGSLQKLITKKRQIKQGAMQTLLNPFKSGVRNKSGYKDTEIGMIPISWEVKALKNVAPLQRGFDLTNFQLSNGVHPVVYSNGILNYHNQAQVKGPGVVTGRSGTIGKVNYIERDFWPHNTTLWVTDFKGNNPKFIYYLFCDVRLERFGTGSGVPTLNRNDVHDTLIALPPVNEQERIANILSDIDTEISALETKLTKYQKIKQGMMQNLLTGRIRLA